MSDQLQFEIIDGARAKLTFEGWEFTRMVTAYEVTGTGDQKLFNAALLPGMPSIGDPHPDVVTAVLEEIIPAAVDGDTVKMTLIYKESFAGGEDINITANGTLTQTETNVDVESELITVSYEFPADYKYNTTLAGQTIEQGALVYKFKPEFVLTLQQRQEDPPYAVQGAYLGKINSIAWRYANDEEKWLCTGITGTTRDRQLWNVTYSFQFNPQGWKERVVFVDPHTGKPPADLVVDVGYKEIDIYDTADFNQLGFELP